MTKAIEERLKQSLKQSIEATEGLYHRLVLLVGKSGAGKTALIQELAEQYNAEPININLCLSKELLELTKRQRKLRIADILQRAVNGKGEKVFLDNIEILFDIDLEQDPLRLLQALSRNLTVIASWNGTFHNGKLTYAEIGHNEYRNYDLSDTLVVSI